MGRSGDYVTNMSGEMAYRSFRPAPLPPEPKLLISNEIISSLTEAHRRLAEIAVDQFKLGHTARARA